MSLDEVTEFEVTMSFSFVLPSGLHSGRELSGRFEPPVTAVHPALTPSHLHLLHRHLSYSRHLSIPGAYAQRFAVHFDLPYSCRRFFTFQLYSDQYSVFPLFGLAWAYPVIIFSGLTLSYLLMQGRVDKRCDTRSPM